MRQRDIEILFAADAVESVVLFRDAISEGMWSAFVYPFEGQAPRDLSEVVQDARGGTKLWKSLDTANAWLRGRGWSGRISIDDTAHAAVGG